MQADRKEEQVNISAIVAVLLKDLNDYMITTGVNWQTENVGGGPGKYAKASNGQYAYIHSNFHYDELTAERVVNIVNLEFKLRDLKSKVPFSELSTIREWFVDAQNENTKLSSRFGKSHLSFKQCSQAKIGFWNATLRRSGANTALETAIDHLDGFIKGIKKTSTVSSQPTIARSLSGGSN